MYTVYLIYSEKHNKIYIGYTSKEPKQRLYAHNHIEKKSYTTKFRPWTLVYTETHTTKSEAMKREKQLKSAKGRAL